MQKKKKNSIGFGFEKFRICPVTLDHESFVTTFINEYLLKLYYTNGTKEWAFWMYKLL